MLDGYKTRKLYISTILNTINISYNLLIIVIIYFSLGSVSHILYVLFRVVVYIQVLYIMMLSFDR